MVVLSKPSQCRTRQLSSPRGGRVSKGERFVYHTISPILRTDKGVLCSAAMNADSSCCKAQQKAQHGPKYRPPVRDLNVRGPLHVRFQPQLWDRSISPSTNSIPCPSSTSQVINSRPAPNTLFCLLGLPYNQSYAQVVENWHVSFRNRTAFASVYCGWGLRLVGGELVGFGAEKSQPLSNFGLEEWLDG
ncbi:hypothetical protein BDV96DRAFT_148803 [Lophiotrema nucula]|uniref:Uncharacterized protein n=1 Tax=Lophiotrema nucula TaxID=690887 RepID=A0A6A5Z3L7_9PLEO|nr:hypothetical protein BDV96DRAFT_148803 [Lophiotrema nucula]